MEFTRKVKSSPEPRRV